VRFFAFISCWKYPTAVVITSSSSAVVEKTGIMDTRFILCITGMNYILKRTHYKMLGFFNPNLGQIWTKPNVIVKKLIKNVLLKVKVNPTFGFVHI